MAFIPLKPIPIKDRNSMIFVSMGRIDVRDGAFIVIDTVNGERMHIPVASLPCIMLEYSCTPRDRPRADNKQVQTKSCSPYIRG